MKTISTRAYVMMGLFCLILIAGLLYYYFFSSLLSVRQTAYICIDKDDNVDSVINKFEGIASKHSLMGLQTLARHGDYAKQIRTGRYAIKQGEGAFVVYRHLKHGMQEPLKLTIPSVRTLDDFAAFLGHKLMMDSTEVSKALKSEDICQQYGYDTLTIIGMFVPNTYEVYWNIPLEKFLKKMKKESDNFWDDGRKQKAAGLELTQNEVSTLASIVDEETSNNAEKPMIAGMYYNRLRQEMPLQADPTIKFALKKFELRRIYNNMLSVNSPYNTYRNIGLPPGPIRIPSVAGIDAVLNMTHHDYLFMCAKEDFSGTHNFARTYQEHLQNAAKYSEALNKRGIQ